MKGLALIAATVLGIMFVSVERPAELNSILPPVTQNSFELGESTQKENHQDSPSRNPIFVSDEVTAPNGSNLEGDDEEIDILPPGTVEFAVYDDGHLTTSVQVVVTPDYVDESDPDFWTAIAILQNNGKFRLGGLAWGSYQASVEIRGTKQEDSFILDKKPPWQSERISFYFGRSRVIGKLCSNEPDLSSSKEVQLTVEDTEGNAICSFQRKGEGKELLFDFENLPVGRAQIYWEATSETNFLWGQMESLLEEGRAHSILLGDCHGLTRIHGTLRTQSNDLIPNARITLMRLDPLFPDRYPCLTKENGRFSLFLAPGIYRVDSIEFHQSRLSLDSSSDNSFEANLRSPPLELTATGCTVILSLPPRQIYGDSMVVVFFPASSEDYRVVSFIDVNQDRPAIVPGIEVGRHRIKLQGRGCFGGPPPIEKTFEVTPEDRLIFLDFRE